MLVQALDGVCKLSGLGFEVVKCMGLRFGVQRLWGVHGSGFRAQLGPYKAGLFKFRVHTGVFGFQGSGLGFISRRMVPATGVSQRSRAGTA